MSNKVDLKTINNNLSVEETLKVQEELKQLFKCTDKEEISRIPYSAEYWTKELKYCLSPLHDLKLYANDLTYDIQQNLYQEMQDDIKIREINPIEVVSFNKIDIATFAELIEDAYKNAVLLIGQLILKGKINYMSIIKVLIDIYQKLLIICEIDTQVWKYYADNEQYAYAYNKAISLVKEVFNNLHIVLTKITDEYNFHYQNKKDSYIFTIKHDYCEDMISYNAENICRLKKIYTYLEKFHMSIVSMDSNINFNIYQDILEDFAIDFGNRLFAMTGESYMLAADTGALEDTAKYFSYLFEKLENSKLEDDDYYFDED